MLLLWHPSLTAINLSYTFPILETSATASCGTTGICQYQLIPRWWLLIGIHGFSDSFHRVFGGRAGKQPRYPAMFSCRAGASQDPRNAASFARWKPQLGRFRSGQHVALPSSRCWDGLSRLFSTTFTFTELLPSSWYHGVLSCWISQVDLWSWKGLLNKLFFLNDSGISSMSLLRSTSWAQSTTWLGALMLQTLTCQMAVA